jgi:uncharacterized phage-like protein YoqJ
MNRIAVNEEVTITSLYFKNQKDFTAFPRRMEYEGTTYNFRDGLQYLIKKGEEIMRIFDMTDGEVNYRLQCDSDQDSWRLLAISR